MKTQVIIPVMRSALCTARHISLFQSLTDSFYPAKAWTTAELEGENFAATIHEVDLVNHTQIAEIRGWLKGVAYCVTQLTAIPSEAPARVSEPL
jgi:hypothetical protein